MLLALIINLLIIIALFLLGVSIVIVAKQSFNCIETMCLAFPLGAGSFTWVLFLASWLGMPIEPVYVIALYLIFLIPLILFSSRYIRQDLIKNQANRGVQRNNLSLHSKIAWSAFGILFIISVIFSVGRSYSEFDPAAFWALKGYGIVHEGTVFAANDWGIFGSAYPLNVSLQISLFKLFSNDILPGSKLLFPLYYAILILGCYYFWRKHRLNTSFSLIGVLFLATNPLIFLHSTLGFANLPFTCHVVLATLLSIQARSRKNHQDMILSGLFWALICWTRPEGIIYTLAILSAILITEGILHRKIGNILLWVVPCLFIILIWFIFSWQSVINSPIADAVIDTSRNATKGILNIENFRIIVVLFVKRGIHPDDWGLFIPVSSILILSSLVKVNPFRQRSIQWLLLPSVVIGILPLALFYVQSFSYEREYLIEILIRSFDRAFLPAALLIMFLAFLMFGTAFEMTEDSKKMTNNVTQ